MRVLVTGADGFVGRHLIRHLRGQGADVVEVWGPGSSSDELRLDVCDAAAVRARVEAAAPEAVFHLAGSASVARSHERPDEAFAVNTVGTVNVLQAVRTLAPRARLLYISSGEVYGSAAGAGLASESTPLAPLSPYAASKVAAEVACEQFGRSYGLDIVRARPFNHIGPGQAPSFVVPSFARQLQAIRRGAEPRLLVGNLDPVRDFSHVDDVVEAYVVLMRQGVSGRAYNVASGYGRSIRQLLEEMIHVSGLDVRVEIDPNRLRPSDLPTLVGDATQLRELGWEPKRTPRNALSAMLSDLD